MTFGGNVWINLPDGQAGESTDIDNRYQYNDKELNNDHGLGWYNYGARFYDAVLGRFTGVDALASEPEQIDKSPYAYVWNNPIRLTDPDGNCPKCLKVVAKTVVKSKAKGKLDLGEVYDLYESGKTLLSSDATLGERAAAVFDLVSPVSTKDVKAVSKVVGLADDGKDAGKVVGSYTNTHESGKKYHGKGNETRAKESAKEKADKYNDPVKETDWTPAKNDREAFKQESKRLENDGGHGSNTNYNQRDSPGTKYRKQDEDN